MNNSARFKRFALTECRGSSGLYEYLSLRIAEDEELLSLTLITRQGQPIPNMFFASVHYLLLSGTDHPLKEFYRSIVDNPRIAEESFPFFKDFCTTYHDEIILLLKNKLVQTNEVRRCTYLYPSFSFIYQSIKKPLSIIEIGTSSGLNLLWDQYKYSYNDNDEIYGNIDSKVHITSEIRGGNTPTLLKNSPPIEMRIGVDLQIVDISKADQYTWMKALIWPEQTERLRLFEQASSSMNKIHSQLIEGDGVALLPSLAEDVPKHSALCIYHTHVANQMPKQIKEDLLKTVEELGKMRDVFHLYNNMGDGKLHLDSYINGDEKSQVIAETDGHARWFKWNL